MPSIADIMSSPVKTVKMDDTLVTVQRLFERNRFHHLVVIENHVPVGVISDRDLYRHISPFIGNDIMERPQDTHTLRKCAHQIMRRNLVTIRINASLEKAAQMMLAMHVNCLPILDEKDHLQGIITNRDLLPYCRGHVASQNDAA